VPSRKTYTARELPPSTSILRGQPSPSKRHHPHLCSSWYHKNGSFRRIPDGKPPRFPKKPTIRQDGDVLVMECLLEANPDPDITWYQGDKSIADSSRVRMLRKTTGKDTYLLTLEISNPTREDGGNYRCNAFNVYGESNANIALNFQGMPRRQAESSLYVCELSTFRCYSSSSNLFQPIPDQYDQYNNFCMSMALNRKPVSSTS
jgi:hypothetical protein